MENFCKVINVAYNCLEMGNYLDKYFLISAYRILIEDESGYFRKTNPVVYSYNHVPTHALDIEEKLDDALRRVYSLEAGNNVILKAMYIHNKLIEIYPFSQYSGELAVFAMNYYLMENGLAPINMPISREDYFNIVGDCLKGHRQEEFYNFLCRAVYDKMQGTIDACREYLKNQNAYHSGNDMIIKRLESRYSDFILPPICSVSSLAIERPSPVEFLSVSTV